MFLTIHPLHHINPSFKVGGRERKKKFSVILVSLLVLTFSQASMATLLNFSGSWTSSGFGGLTPDPFAGSFSFQFDDSGLTGSGNESFDNLPLTSLGLNPATIGATTYSASNSVGFVEFIDGVLTRYELGGDTDGGTSISAGTDDFLVQVLFDTNGIFHSVSVYLANANETSFISAAGNTSFKCYRCPTAQAPEPTSQLLMGLGLAGFGFARRRKVK